MTLVQYTNESMHYKDNNYIPYNLISAYSYCLTACSLLSHVIGSIIGKLCNSVSFASSLKLCLVEDNTIFVTIAVPNIDSL
jgi:hypothetical protein